MKKDKLPSEEIQRLLLDIVEHFDDEDRAVRERQIRKCKRLKLYWDNIFQAWFSEVAHDWRIWDASMSQDVSDQGYYDKPINIFRSYIETIVAALSVSTPAAKCFPYDADNGLDVATAKAGDKIARLINNHNNSPLLWLRALVTYYTEGTVYGYSYPDTKEKYGTYDENKYEETTENKATVVCPNCGEETAVDDTTEVFMPEEQAQEQPELAPEMAPEMMPSPEIPAEMPPEGMPPEPGMEAAAPEGMMPQGMMPPQAELDLCPKCGQQVQMESGVKAFIVTKLVGKDKSPKTRVCLEVLGGLYVKIANYAKKAEDTPYLIYSYETHYANAMQEYEHLLDKDDFLRELKAPGPTGPRDTYSQWGRMNTIYMGEYPNYVVTMRKCWLRPSSYNVLCDKDKVKKLKKLYPRGVKVCLVNDEFGSAEDQNLDDYWTISVNPEEDYLCHDPAGIPLIATQEITNDIISLVLQTMEHGIGQTFADPGVLNFKAYRETETMPGGVYEANPKSGKSVGDGFFQLKTATLSAEVMPFFEMIQSMAQLVSGALPSLFGGQLTQGSNTASEYSMSQANARQRIQNIFKLFTHWWKELQGKAIPIYINNVKYDEQNVDALPDGSFINTFIRMSELHGRIGKVELEAGDNLPLTWTQTKETIMKMIEAQNPIFLQMISAPENIPVLRDAIGLNDFYIPGEDDRIKQNDEIRQLLMSEPIQDPMAGMQDPEMAQSEGASPQMPFMPSVEIDPTYDNHAIQFEIVRQWATSEAGRMAKIENEAGYQNVLLHGQMHYFEMNKQLTMQATAAGGPGAAPPEGQDNPSKPPKSSKISGEEDVSTVQ